MAGIDLLLAIGLPLLGIIRFVSVGTIMFIVLVGAASFSWRKHGLLRSGHRATSMTTRQVHEPFWSALTLVLFEN